MAKYRAPREPKRTPDPFEYQRVGAGMRSDTAYAVTLNGVFLGYAVGRGGEWDRQSTSNPNEPVKPTHQFLYAQPSRRYVAECLAADAGTPLPLSETL